ncbi:hypothetical protein BH11MYX1_BH11MYX1_28670 [soil metagenome]
MLRDVRIGLGICLALGFAHAALGEPAGPAATDKAEADRLFDQARDLLTAGDRVQACKLFELSLRKDPRAVGTMLNLGLCREEGGAIASATRYYAEARDRAHDQHLDQHQAAAERKLAMLAPRVPHLKIVLPPNTPATTRVIVDDLVLSLDQLGDVTVDPGERSIVIAAPEKLPYETKVTIVEAEHRTVVVPPLQGVKTVLVAASPRALYGKLTVAGGALVGATAIGLGLYAVHLHWSQFPDASRDGAAASDPGKNCFTYTDTRLTSQYHCNPAGASKLRTADRYATASTYLSVASVVVMGVGAYLWYSAPNRVVVDVAPDHAGVVLAGRF